MATIPRKGRMLLVFDAATTPVQVDISCWGQALDISTDTETIDVGTICAPGATENGVTTESIVVPVRWDAAMYTALLPHLNEEAQLVYALDENDTDAILATVKYSSMPWGRFEPGQVVEADLALAVLDTITYGAIPAYVTP